MLPNKGIDLLNTLPTSSWSLGSCTHQLFTSIPKAQAMKSPSPFSLSELFIHPGQPSCSMHPQQSWPFVEVRNPQGFSLFLLSKQLLWLVIKTENGFSIEISCDTGQLCIIIQLYVVWYKNTDSQSTWFYAGHCNSFFTKGILFLPHSSSISQIPLKSLFCSSKPKSE